MILYVIIAILIALGLQRTLYSNMRTSQVKEVTYSEFLSMVDDDKVKTVSLNQSTSTITFSTGEEGTTYETTS